MNTFHKVYHIQDDVSEVESSSVAGKFRESYSGSLPLSKIMITHIFSSIPFGFSTYFHETYCHRCARGTKKTRTFVGPSYVAVRLYIATVEKKTFSNSRFSFSKS